VLLILHRVGRHERVGQHEAAEELGAWLVEAETDEAVQLVSPARLLQTVQASRKGL
jgi:hypothetical protein